MHSTLYKIIIVILLFLTCLSCGVAIPPNLSLQQCRMDNWSVRDGLPERVIYSIAQTPDGFIWLATDEGLIRFDGGAFKIFNTSNTTGLIDNKMRNLLVDKNGQLWYGATWSGFGKFSNNRFIRYGPKDIRWTSTNCLFQDADGSIWASLLGDSHLFHIVNDQTILVSGSGINDIIAGIGTYSKNSIYCVTDSGAIVEVSSHNVKTRNLVKPKFANMFVSCQLKRRNGDILMGSANNGLMMVRNNVVTTYDISKGLPSNNITCLYEDRYNRIWIGTNVGLLSWDGKKFDYFCKNEGLIDNDIHAIMEDKEGNLWVSAGSSLCRFSATKLTPFVLSHEAEKASFNDSGAICHSQQGGVWCASSLGLYLVKNDKLIHFSGPFNRSFAYVADGQDGLVWLCCSNKKQIDVVAVPIKDIIRYSSFETPKGDLNRNTLIEDTWFAKYHPIAIDPFNTLLAGKGFLLTIGLSGLTKITPGKQIVNRKLELGWVFNSRMDANGDILIGSTEGLLKLHNNQFIKCNQGFPVGAHVLGISITDRNTIWLATDKGLIRRTNNTAMVYNISAGLPSNDLYQIQKDDFGDVWLACTDGIFSVHISDLDLFDAHKIAKIPYSMYKSAEGVRSYPVAFNSDKSIDGTLWFSGSYALIHVDPAHFRHNEIPPAVEIIDAKIDNTNIDTDHISTVKPGYGNLDIKYSALTYQAPEKVRYRYRITCKPLYYSIVWGHSDPAWIEAGDKRSATYTNLAPGQYQFTVVACNNDGLWNMKGHNLTFTIKPHYYQTVWFACLVLIIIVGGVVLLFKYRTHQIQLYNQELARKVAERTRDLNTAYENLEAQKVELEAQHIDLESAHQEIVTHNEELQAMQEELEAQNDELIMMHESLEKANAKLEDLATSDGLTGLKNYRTFQEYLNNQYIKTLRYGGNLSLVMLDVDHFKQINDTYGHPSGDDILRKIARTLIDNIRECDFAARYGGEEFIIVASETDSVGATELAERLRSKIDTAYWPICPVTASFGVSTVVLKSNIDIEECNLTTINEAVELLIDQADRALYQSKHNGRNRVSHYFNTNVDAIKG